MALYNKFISIDSLLDTSTTDVPLKLPDNFVASYNFFLQKNDSVTASDAQLTFDIVVDVISHLEQLAISFLPLQRLLYITRHTTHLHGTLDMEHIAYMLNDRISLSQVLGYNIT